MNPKETSRRLKRQKRHYVFPYVRFHGKHYPLIPITLKNKKKEINTFALLDSGASISVFRPEVAVALGIKSKARGRVELKTANGEVRIDMAKIQMIVEDSQFSARVGFTHNFSANFNIIGREGFFHHFSVCFNEVMKTVVMVPLHRR